MATTFRQAGTYPTFSSPVYASGFQTAGAVTTLPATMNPVQTTSVPSVQYMSAAQPMQSSRTFTTSMPSVSMASSAYTMPMAQPVSMPMTTTIAAAPAAPMVTQAAPMVTQAAPMVTQALPTMVTQAAPMVTQAPVYTSAPVVTSAPLVQSTPIITSAPRIVGAAPVMPAQQMVGRNLLLMGNVVSERRVPYEELMASGALRVEEQPVVVQAPVVEQLLVEQIVQPDGTVQQVLVEQPVQQFVQEVVQADGTVAQVLVEQPAQQYVQEVVQPDGTVQQVLVEQQGMVEQAAPGGPIEGLLNQAFVYIKPHAVTEITINTVRDMLQQCGITVVQEGDLTSDIIDERKLIDQHYYSIASKATMLTPDQLPVDDAKFQACFGIPWEQALPNSLNAMDAMQALESNNDEISQLWKAAKDNGKLVKLGGGFYCGLLEKPGYQPIYTFNAFFMSMRSDYVAPGASIHWFAVEWDEKAIPWSDFRGQVLGPTDPANAPPNSIRGMILANWQELGLASQPNTGNNGVHASASPLEALYERMNWLGVPCAEDIFGSFLLQCQVPPEFIDHCAVDPQVNLPDGSTGSVWDYLEDADASTCVDKFVNLVNVNMG